MHNALKGASSPAYGDYEVFHSRLLSFSLCSVGYRFFGGRPSVPSPPPVPKATLLFLSPS